MSSSAGSAPHRFGYRNRNGWLPAVILPVVAVVGVGLIVAAILGDVPVGFAVFWVFGVLWNGYWFLLRFGFHVEVVDGVLEWRALLAKRRVPIEELSANGSLWMGIETLKVSGQRSLIVSTRGRGWITFLEALNRATGSETFHPSVLNRLTAKLPLTRWSDGYYED